MGNSTRGKQSHTLQGVNLQTALDKQGLTAEGSIRNQSHPIAAKRCFQGKLLLEIPMLGNFQESLGRNLHARHPVYSCIYIHLIAYYSLSLFTFYYSLFTSEASPCCSLTSDFLQDSEQ